MFDRNLVPKLINFGDSRPAYGQEHLFQTDWDDFDYLVEQLRNLWPFGRISEPAAIPSEGMSSSALPHTDAESGAAASDAASPVAQESDTLSVNLQCESRSEDVPSVPVERAAVSQSEAKPDQPASHSSAVLLATENSSAPQPKNCAPASVQSDAPKKAGIAAPVVRALDCHQAGRDPIKQAIVRSWKRTKALCSINSSRVSSFVRKAL